MSDMQASIVMTKASVFCSFLNLNKVEIVRYSTIFLKRRARQCLGKSLRHAFTRPPGSAFPLLPTRDAGLSL